MEEKTATAIEKMEELRFLHLLEESEREAKQGLWLTHEEVFTELRKRLDDSTAKGYEERANAV